MDRDTLRYDQIRQKSSHNSYQRKEGIYDQVLYWQLRSLEVDIYREKLGRKKLRNDWYVLHWIMETSDIDKLSDFLNCCLAFGRALPKHEPITVFVDLKDSFGSGKQTATMFDRKIRRMLGKRLFAPADLLKHGGSAPTLRAALKAEGWPTLRALRGRFLFVLTGKTAWLADYAKTGGAKRAAFVAPAIDTAAAIRRQNYAVFFNLKKENVGLGRAVDAAGFVSRVYGLETATDWRKGVANRCHHLATDFVNSAKYPWADTTSDDRYPFTCLDGPTPSGRINGASSLLRAATGDIWSDRDSFLFHYRKCAPSEVEQSYRQIVTCPNSYIPEWTKGGLMARASLHPNAPYFAVLRVGYGNVLRIQYRRKRGGMTSKFERAIAPEFTIDPQNLAFIMLKLSKGGKWAEGKASTWGRRWKPIGVGSFDEPLVYHGLAVSSHGRDEAVSYLFTARDGRHPPFAHTAKVGGCRSGIVVRYPA